MRKYPLIGALLGATAFGCVGGDDEVYDPATSPDTVDSGIVGADANSSTGSDAGATGSCNPVTQVGCGPSEKCANIVLLPNTLSVTECVPDGTVEPGEACERGEPGPAGYDNCMKGHECIGAVCREICQQEPDSCSGGNCVMLAGHFQDLDGIGFCATECDPVAQTGCGPSEKCANILVHTDPTLSATGCVPDGTVEPGEACERPEPGSTTGYDNCKKGYGCRNGVCREICQRAPDSCTDGNCVLIENQFGDLENVGLCATSCNPVIQDCIGDDEACYLNTVSGASSCSRVPDETEGLGQGSICYGPEPDKCYLNGCPEGFSPILNSSPGPYAGSVCAAFCSPMTQHTGDTTMLGGDPSGITCAARGAVGAECRFVSTFYSNTPLVPDTVGFCVPPELWGSCANHVLDSEDPETFVPGCQPLSDSGDP